MAGRDPRESRILGLWTAGWLAVMLVAGLLWIGELSVQWPVLLGPLLWALIALRPRCGGSCSRCARAGGGARPPAAGGPPARASAPTPSSDRPCGPGGATATRSV